MFTKATKKQARLRMAIFGPSGSGKTFSALRIAKGLGGRVAVIDTEYGSASKYADRFEFDTCSLEGDQTIPAYIKAMQAAQEYPILIIDSLSHGWQELLAEMDRLAQTKYKGNSFAAWKDGTPKQKMMVKALLSSPCHIIATMRSKTEWALEQDSHGKNKPVRVGLAPEEGKGIEYEFDLLMELNTEHRATILKDRTGKYQDAEIQKPGEEFGVELARWLSDGEPLPPVDPADVVNRSLLWGALMRLAKNDQKTALAGLKKYGGVTDLEAISGVRLVAVLKQIEEIEITKKEAQDNA